jgi:hypothetical protein
VRDFDNFRQENTVMKRVSAILLLLMSGALAFGGQSSSEWVRYTSPEGRYHVLVPTQPKLSTQEASAASGEKFTQYFASASELNAFFLIGYFDYVPAMTFSLDKARDGMVEAVKGTLLSESAISLGGSPGREMKVSAKGSDGNEYLFRVRAYDVDKRVYVLQFITQRSADDTASAEEATRYFDSFQVMKTP